MKKIISIFICLFSLEVYPQNIAIIDGGLRSEYYNRYSSLIRGEACFSQFQDDFITETAYERTAYYYRTISICRSGLLSAFGNGSSKIPRTIVSLDRHSSSAFDTIESFPGYVSNISLHNTYVLEAAKSVSANPNQILNVTAARIRNETGFNQYTVPGPLSFRYSFEGTDQNTIANALAYVNSIASFQNISVVSLSISFGYLNAVCSLNGSPLRGPINSLRNKGVVIVAASGNDWVTLNTMGFPACANEVVSVGAVNSSGALYNYSASGSGLDFLGYADVPKLDSSHAKQSGTSLATPRVATYLGRLKIRNPSKSMTQIVAALKQVGKKIPDGRTNVTASRAFNTDFLKADELLKGKSPVETPPSGPQFPPVPKIDVREFGYGQTNVGSYGVGFGGGGYNQGYGFNVVLAEVANTTISSGLAAKMTVFKISESQLLAQAATSCGSMYQVKYQAYDIDTSSEVALYINNIRIKFLALTGNNTLRSRKVEFCGSRLRRGKNLIEFRKSNNNEAWGVRNIVLEFVDRGSINLTVGTRNTGSYGYGFGSNRHRSQLVANFTNPNNGNDLTFSVTGWDIDRADETRIYLNDRILGFLSTNCSSCFNGGDTFEIPSDKLKSGTNQLTFIQRSPDATWNGFQDEKWGVTDLLIKEKGGDIVPMLQLLLLDD